MLAAVKWAELGELVWVAPLAALAVCTAYSLLVLGAVRVADARRDGNGGAVAGYATLALVSALVVGACVVFGLDVIVS